MTRKYIKSLSTSFANMEIQMKATKDTISSRRQNFKVWKCQNLNVRKGQWCWERDAHICCCKGIVSSSLENNLEISSTDKDVCSLSMWTNNSTYTICIKSHVHKPRNADSHQKLKETRNRVSPKVSGGSAALPKH